MNNAQSPDIGALIADGNTLFTAIEQAKDAILDQLQALAETDPSSAKFQQTEDKFYLCDLAMDSLFDAIHYLEEAQKR